MHATPGMSHARATFPGVPHHAGYAGAATGCPVSSAERKSRMRVVRRVAAVLATAALMTFGGLATPASAVSIDVAGLVLETPQV